MTSTEIAQKPDGFQPTFMFGFERSGTTLLSMMVGAHPEIAVPLSTTGMWYRLYRQFQQSHSISREELVDSILGHERIKLWDIEFDRTNILNHLKTIEWNECLAGFHDYYARQKGKLHWASMDISHMNHLGLLNQWFPSARFLHIIRDPRDVALSFKGYRYGSTNILEVAQKWVSEVGCSLREGMILGENRYHVIRYEDLILHTEQTLKDICVFIGVGYSPQMLDYSAMVEAKVPEDKRDLWPALTQNPQKDKVERWRRELSQAERFIIEDQTRTLLHRLKYSFSPAERRSIYSFFLEFWHYMNRGNRINRVIKQRK